VWVAVPKSLRVRSDEGNSGVAAWKTRPAHVAARGKGLVEIFVAAPAAVVDVVLRIAARGYSFIVFDHFRARRIYNESCEIFAGA
jgi:hypothetical protein